MTIKILNDVDIKSEVVECDEPELTTEQMLIDMSNQMKEKFNENEMNMNSIKRKCILFRHEILTTAGMVDVLDDLVHQFDHHMPGEISILMSLLQGRLQDFLSAKIITDTSLIIDEDTDDELPIIDITVNYGENI